MYFLCDNSLKGLTSHLYFKLSKHLCVCNNIIKFIAIFHYTLMFCVCVQFP